MAESSEQLNVVDRTRDKLVIIDSKKSFNNELTRLVDESITERLDDDSTIVSLINNKVDEELQGFTIQIQNQITQETNQISTNLTNQITNDITNNLAGQLSGVMSQEEVNTVQKIALNNLGGYRVMRAVGSNGVSYGDHRILSHQNLIIGISLQAASKGNLIPVLMRGQITEQSWNWDEGGYIFCGNTGLLTQEAPTDGFLSKVGVAISPTTMEVVIERSIILLNI